MNNKDDMGDRLKGFEAVETHRKLDINLPIIARLDGRGFSKFTKGLRRPFDERMSTAMISVAKALVDKTDARISYVQSDEISLVFLSNGENSSVFFEGKIQKMTSILASMASVLFMKEILSSDNEFAKYADRFPHFDARVFQVPTKEEAANIFLWREMDATRNAIQMTAHSVYSHKKLHKVSCNVMREMLNNDGIDFESYPVFFKRGTFLKRFLYERSFTKEELNKIPEKHRPEKDALVTRSEVREIDMPSFVTVVNRAGVIFDNEVPLIRRN